jgi:hypothetical protein
MAVGWFHGPKAVASDLVSFLRRSCEGPGVHEVDGRLFFEDEQVAGGESFSEKGAELVVELLRARKSDPKLSLVLVRTREDTCRAVHRLSARSYDVEVEAIRRVGIPVLDPSSAFSAACLKTELYLPDGHWNARGHELFAATVRQLVALKP